MGLVILGMTTTILGAYVASFILSPFPHWPSYFKIFKNVILNSDQFSLKIRVAQAKQLSLFVLTHPLMTTLWYLDEILYSSYHRQNVNPIFIVGLPRSGTTFLHKTLLKDSDTFVAGKMYEWMFPSITFHKLIGLVGLRNKLEQSKINLSTEAGHKEIGKRHDLSLGAYEEDAFFFIACFFHHFQVLGYFYYEDLVDYMTHFNTLSITTRRHAMQTHRKVLQKIQYLRGPTKPVYFLSKEIAPHDKSILLAEMYPEAKFIITTRPLEESINSLLDFFRLAQMMTVTTEIDLLLYPRTTKKFIENLQKDAMDLQRFCETQNTANQRVYVAYRPFLSNIKATIIFIYQRLGLDLTPEYLDYLDQLQEEQKKRESGYAVQKRFTITTPPAFDAFLDHIENAHSEAIRQVESYPLSLKPSGEKMASSSTPSAELLSHDSSSPFHQSIDKDTKQLERGALRIKHSPK